MPTLSKSTDTKRAATTGRSTKSPAVKRVAKTERVVSVAKVAAFIELVGKDDAIRVKKVQHIAAELRSGSTVGGLTATYSAALIVAGKSIPVSFQSSISQAKVCSERSALVRLLLPENGITTTQHRLNTESVILSCLGLVNVAKSRVDTFISEFNGSAAEFAIKCRELVRADKAAKDATKADKPAAGAKAPKDGPTDSPSVPVVIPLSFNDILTELDLRLKSADPKTRADMVTQLARVVAKTNPVKVAA